MKTLKKEDALWLRRRKPVHPGRPERLRKQPDLPPAGAGSLRDAIRAGYPGCSGCSIDRARDEIRNYNESKDTIE